MQRLLDGKEADPNYKEGKQGFTSLWAASFVGRLRIVKMLVKKGKACAE